MSSLSLLSRSASTSSVTAPAFSWAWSNGGRGAAWVRPLGELDLATAPELDAALGAAGAHARLVILDLRGLEFIDSSGAHVIVEAILRAALAGRRLVVIRGIAQVQRVFEMTGADEGIEMFDLPVPSPGARADLELVRTGPVA